MKKTMEQIIFDSFQIEAPSALWTFVLKVGQVYYGMTAIHYIIVFNILSFMSFNFVWNTNLKWLIQQPKPI